MNKELLSFTRLKSQLLEAKTQLQQVNFADRQATELAVAQVNDAVASCKASAAANEQHLFPLVAPFEPAIVDTLQQHQQSIGYADIDLLLNMLQEAPATAARIDAGNRLIAAFEAFVNAKIKYLIRLQKALAGVLEQYYTQAYLSIETERIYQATAQRTKIEIESESTIDETAFRRQALLAEMEMAKACMPQQVRIAAQAPVLY